MRNSCHAQKNALESLFQYHLNMILLKVGKFRKQIIIFPFPPKNQQKFSDSAAMILPKKLGHNLKKILPFFEEMKTKQSAAEIF